MRWIWIDRFIEFESGQRARAIKNVSLAEEHLHDHFHGFPMMPASLILEGLAQTGGILVGEARGFQDKVILAKVPRVAFHFPAVPGDTLTYTATLESASAEGARVAATAHVGERLQTEAEIVFANLASDQQSAEFFDPQSFVFTMKLLGVFDVGRGTTGILDPPGVAALRARG